MRLAVFVRIAIQSEIGGSVYELGSAWDWRGQTGHSKNWQPPRETEETTLTKSCTTKLKIVAIVNTTFMALKTFANRILKALGPEDPNNSL